MKNLLIIYNIVFLFTGNVLLSSAHHLFSHDHHNHSHSLIEEHECLECVNIDNSSNFIDNFTGFDFSNNISTQLIQISFENIIFDIFKSNINIFIALYSMRLCK